ncbi:MAG: biotin carboxylase N-terminal domain-containing protein [Myxococcota bacterium]
MFTRLLIADRGEAAVRVGRTCKRLGITTIALRGERDADGSLHVDACDETRPFIRDPAALVELAKEAEADAIHPGYGEQPHAELLRVAEQAGVPVISPPAAVLDACTDPTRMRSAAERVGVRFRPDEGLDRPRLLTMLLAADAKDAIAPLGEMERVHAADGSLVLAEAPSPALTIGHEGDAIREAMAEACRRLLGELGVRGLVSVDWLLDMEGHLWWAGVRAGLPSHHAPLELITGVDPVELQLRLVAGEPLDPELHHLQPTGHAFLTMVRAATTPTEPVEEMRWPPAPHGRLRVDPCVQTDAVPEGPLLLKIATVAPIRHVALLTLDRVLAATTVAPYGTNTNDLRQLLGDECFRAGQYDTSFVQRVVAAA